jgi:hypothetical protein
LPRGGAKVRCPRRNPTQTKQSPGQRKVSPGAFQFQEGELPATAAAATGSTTAATATAAATGSATATAALVSAAAATTGSAAAFRTGTGFIHIDGSPAKFRAIQRGNGGFRLIGVRHFDEGEATGLTGFAVIDDGNVIHGAVLSEDIEELILRRAEAQITYEKFGHSLTSLELYGICRWESKP